MVVKTFSLTIDHRNFLNIIIYNERVRNVNYEITCAFQHSVNIVMTAVNYQNIPTGYSFVC